MMAKCHKFLIENCDIRDLLMLDAASHIQFMANNPGDDDEFIKRFVKNV